MTFAVSLGFYFWRVRMKEIDSVQSTIAIMAISGIQLSQETVDLLYKVKDGEIAYDEAIAMIKEKLIS